MPKMRPLLASLGLVALLPEAAMAADSSSPLLAGMGHLLGDPLHFVATLAVGWWAGRLRGPAMWAFPLSFAAGMALAFVLLTGHLPVPSLAEQLIEIVVVGSTFSLVTAVLLSPRLPMQEAVSTLLAIGLCHGHVHNVAPFAPSIALFGVGAISGAGLLLALGVALGLVSQPAAE